METKRVTIPALEEILGQEFKVLDHGHIRLIDYMGDDSSIVQAARVSYGGGTKSVSEDSGLISYLIRHKHTTPLEMCELKLHCKMPIFVARQWIRHRTASVNEMSARYSIIKDEFYIPTEWREQAKHNKQASEGIKMYYPSVWELAQYAIDGPDNLVFDGSGDHFSIEAAAFKEYESRIKAGIGREIARCCLPVSTYTEWYWKCDLHNIMNFLRLRADSHAQPEIRVYADIMVDIVKRWCPFAWEHFENHVKNAVVFSADEAELFRTYYMGTWAPIPDQFAEERLGKSRAREFKEKLYGKPL